MIILSYSVRELAKKYGVSYRTAWRWISANRLPDAFEVTRLPSGRIRLLGRQELAKEKTVIYARINPKVLLNDLDQQIESCEVFCQAKGWPITKIYREIAPGVGAKRVKLLQVIRNPPNRVVIAYPSVLSRFDHTFYEFLLERAGCSLVVVNAADEQKGEHGALEDVTDAISLTCRKHYGPKKGAFLVEQIKKMAHL